jgi:cytidyltransferase-like protein
MPRDHNEFSLETLFRICHELKKNKKRIVFTHGTFDLFHYSHLCLLRESAKLGDYLIVGIEQDKNVAEYKSYKRPIVSEQKRFEVVSELNCVNQAFINRFPMTDETYEYLCKELNIDILTIGCNFGFVDKVKDRTQKLNIKLEQLDIPYEPTTSIINDIIKKHTTK